MQNLRIAESKKPDDEEEGQFNHIKTVTCKTEWEKVWSRLSAHLQPFFSALSTYFNIFWQKYHILTCRDKRESYLIVLQQNNV